MDLNFSQGQILSEQTMLSDSYTHDLHFSVWLSSVFVSYCCYNKLPTQICSYNLEARSLNARYWQNCIPSGGCRREPFPGLFPLLAANCIPWLSVPSSQHSNLLLLSSHLLLLSLICLPLIRTLTITSVSCTIMPLPFRHHILRQSRS